MAMIMIMMFVIFKTIWIEELQILTFLYEAKAPDLF